ncbi:MAG: FAD/NAD(P)-binding oxidoreductase [Chloroflexota bacterium]
MGTTTKPHYLIIGNGAAGLSAAELIRSRDPHGRITIVSDEHHLFYSRPGIAYLSLGQITEHQLLARNKAFYQQHHLDLHFGHVTGLDLERQVAYLDKHSHETYDVLLLATGSRAVRPSLPGIDLDGVLTFDTLEDAKQVIRHGRRAKTAVVVGGGITAMELAEALHHQGARTVFLQRGDHLWPRLFDERESSIIEQQIRHRGIDLRYKEELAEILGQHGRVAGVRLKSGQVVKCEAVGVAVGVRPNLDLVKGLPIAQDQGILVNEFMQAHTKGEATGGDTGNGARPGQPVALPLPIFAAGDVAQIYDRWTGRPQLDILWPSALNGGRAAGANMVDVAYGRAPQFPYQKGSPFNAALLFDVHLTVIGRIGTEGGRIEDAEEVAYLSRGASQVWTTSFTSGYRSAWDKNGPNSVRILLAGGRIVGALILGNQDLADPLRRLINQEVDVSQYEAELLNSGPDLPQVIQHISGWV